MTLQQIIEEIENITEQATNDDVQFVSTIVEDLISAPHHRITKLEIERCNNLYKQYKEIK